VILVFERGKANTGGASGEKPRRTVLLVYSEHLSSSGLRTVLRELEDVRLVGETYDTQTAVTVARSRQPSGVVAGLDIGKLAIIDLAQQLKAASPSSRLMVFAEKVDRETLHAPRGMNAYSYVLWEEATPRTVRHVLDTVLDAGLCVASPRVVEELLSPPPTAREPSVTDRERAVLRGLAKGLSAREIAEATGLGLRTVERMIPDLEERFGVDSLYELRLHAHDFGYGA
jgi:DNA-binding NarL/FixJ family response regulator